MLAAYIFCLVVGGGFLLLSLFGDFLEADADIDADADLGIGDAGDVAKLFSLRAIVYALFGFGAAGSLLHLVWGGARPGLTALVAGITGLATGALIGAAFGFLKRSSAGALLGEQSFVGLTGGGVARDHGGESGFDPGAARRPAPRHPRPTGRELSSGRGADPGSVRCGGRHGIGDRRRGAGRDEAHR